MDFEDVRLCDLLTKVEDKAVEIAATRKASEFKELGLRIQNVYDFFITAKKPYENIQPTLKNLFSAFNYAAVIINDGIKNKRIDKEGTSLLNECLQIIPACCNNIKKQLENRG